MGPSKWPPCLKCLERENEVLSPGNRAAPASREFPDQLSAIRRVSAERLLDQEVNARHGIRTPYSLCFETAEQLDFHLFATALPTRDVLTYQMKCAVQFLS